MLAIIRTRWHTRPLSRRARHRSSAAPGSLRKKYADIVYPPNMVRLTNHSTTSGDHRKSVLGCPISRSLTACCACLELRPLPSTGITQLPRYYGPLRHPTAPGLSLAGVRLIIPDHALGLPVLRALSLCTCCRHYPGA